MLDEKARAWLSVTVDTDGYVSIGGYARRSDGEVRELSTGYFATYDAACERLSKLLAESMRGAS